jgi:hypothetical protein
MRKAANAFYYAIVSFICPLSYDRKNHSIPTTYSCEPEKEEKKKKKKK